MKSLFSALVFLRVSEHILGQRRRGIERLEIVLLHDRNQFNLFFRYLVSIKNMELWDLS
jgi:hypothetical protein